MRSGSSPIQRLRLTIDCLPVRTRRAMLEGLDANDIIVGAYTTRDGVCPMLAAHRCGGRTDLLSFARAWDRFTRVGRNPRRATPRELRILRFELEASLLAEERVDLAQAIADYRLGRERRRRDAALPEPVRSRPGDSHRGPQLRGRPGWAWLRPLRRLDDYEGALRRLQIEPDSSPRGSLQPDRQQGSLGWDVRARDIRPSCRRDRDADPPVGPASRVLQAVTGAGEHDLRHDADGGD